MSGGVATSLRSVYLCYLTLDDPLAHTQVVAYLAGLAERGHTIHLVTFDPPLPAARRAELATQMREHGIVWHSLRYHKRPSLPATIYDVLVGSVAALRLVRRHRLSAIHARNHVPAAMALIVMRLTGVKLIFDIRGLMAQEYADAGRWRRGGLPYRITQRVQRAAIRRAAAVVTLTHAVQPYLFGSQDPPAITSVIPCCVDIDRLQVDAEAEKATRAELSSADGVPIMLYVGKFTGWYMEREMVAFFNAARTVLPGLRFAVLTQAEHEPIVAAFDEAGVSSADYVITSAGPQDIGRYLAVADFGISFVRPCLSKTSSSPTKIGEYLAAGLPVVSTAGIGDVDELLEDGGVGVLVRDLSTTGYGAAVARLQALLADPAHAERCRTVAREKLSLRHIGIPRYERVYRAVAALS